MEAELRRINETLEDEVQKRTATLIRLNEQLQERAEQLRRLAGELTMTEQRERKHLAKILHDGLQQYLVAAKMQIGSASPLMGDPEAIQTAIEVDTLLNDALRVSRTLAAELSPPILHDAGLLAGLEWLARWKLEKHGLKVELRMEQMDAPTLPDDVKAFLFEAIRELLECREDGTKIATIHLSHQDGEHLRISVSDHGRGLDVRSIGIGKKDVGGFGLFSIGERISLIGGKFEYESSSGNGVLGSL